MSESSCKSGQNSDTRINVIFGQSLNLLKKNYFNFLALH